MGLGFPALSSAGSRPFFNTLIAQKALKSPVFTFALAETGSQLLLGGIDTSKYIGTIGYTPVTQAVYWTVSILISMQAILR